MHVMVLKNKKAGNPRFYTGDWSPRKGGTWRWVGRKGWRRAGESLAKGWRKVGEGLAKGFLAPSNFTIPETQRLRIYPYRAYPMVSPLPRPWSETMVSIPLRAQKAPEIKGFLGLARPFLDLVSHTPHPRGRGRPWFAEKHPFRRAGL